MSSQNVAPPTGILPIGSSVHSVMVGHGIEKDDCGKFLTYGCLNIEAHNHSDNPEHHDHADVWRIKVSCNRPSCPVCYEKWAMRVAQRVAHRFKHARLYKEKALNVVHLTAELHAPLKASDTPEKLRTRLIKALKRRGILGGSIVYHATRRRCVKCNAKIPPKWNRCPVCASKWEWKISPHFHILTYDWLENVGQNYQKDHWFVKNLRMRKSVLGTVYYELNHAGYLGDKKHHVTWFGDLNSRNFKCVKLPKPELKCRICGAKLKKLYYVGEKPLPTEEGKWFWLPDCFKTKAQLEEDPPDHIDNCVQHPALRKQRGRLDRYTDAENQAYADYEATFKS